jgi:hypothetical protein
MRDFTTGVNPFGALGQPAQHPVQGRALPGHIAIFRPALVVLG